MNFAELSQALSNSLSLSAILVLLALGLSITFGVMKVINMAHGDMVMLGAYTAFAVDGFLRRNPIEGYDLANYGLLFSIPISFFVVGFVGWLMEVFLIRHLYGRPLDTLLATWGAGMVIQQLVLLWFGADLKSLSPPWFLEPPPITIGPLDLHRYRIFIVGICILCLFLVYAWFYWTSFGLKIRAVVQNRPMAMACGISSRKVDSLTFAFATGLAGVAGCMLGHIYTIKYDMGNDYIVEAFMVVILGGLGQLAGSVGAGVLMGFAKGFASKYLPIMAAEGTIPKFIGNEMMAQFLVISSVVVFLIIRPQGLLTTRERSYE